MKAAQKQGVVMRLFVLIAVLSLVGAGWYIDRVNAQSRSSLTGVFESQPIEVSSRVAGRVSQILAQEGAAINARQTLLLLEAAPAVAEARAKEDAANQARQQLREARNGPRREDIWKQRAVVAEAEADLARLRHGARPEEIAQAQARLRQADAAYRKAAAGPRPQELTEASAAAQSARARLAEVQHGPTAEERAQTKAQLDSAIAKETLADADLKRYTPLLAQEAVTRQQFDRVQADQGSAAAARREAEEAWTRAQEGTRPEQIEQARQNFRQAQSALDLLRAGTRTQDIEAAAADRDQARAALDLLRHGSRREDIQAAEARLAQAQAGLAVLYAGTRPEQIAQLRAAVASAAAQAESQRITVAERAIRAPRGGVVERILVSAGDFVPAGESVARLSDPADIWVRVFVPESALSHLHVGQDAQIQVSGIDRPLTAFVESIATQGEFTPVNLQTPEERGKQVFGVRLRLKQPDPRVKAGMFVTVRRLGDWAP